MATTITCPKCGRPRESYLRYCRSCGDTAALNSPDARSPVAPSRWEAADVSSCSRCGAKRDAAFRYCPACGLDFDGPAEKTIAGPGPMPQVTPTMSRRQYAETAKAIQNLGIATRVFGCLGMILGLFVGAIVGQAIAPQ